MLSQQITQWADGSGRLVVDAPDLASFPDLVSIASELSIRPNVTTNGPITTLPEQPPVPE